MTDKKHPHSPEENEAVADKAAAFIAIIVDPLAERSGHCPRCMKLAIAFQMLGEVMADSGEDSDVIGAKLEHMTDIMMAKAVLVDDPENVVDIMEALKERQGKWRQ